MKFNSPDLKLEIMHIFFKGKADNQYTFSITSQIWSEYIKIYYESHVMMYRNDTNWLLFLNL